MTIEELREKLEGVYDLGNALDCEAVIRMLLRDLDGANRRAETATDKLKVLAFMVSQGKPETRERAQEILAGSGKKEEVWDFLMEMCEEIRRAEAMSAEDLGEDVLNRVWSEMDMQTRESAILAELIRRFRSGDVEGAVLQHMEKCPFEWKDGKLVSSSTSSTIAVMAASEALIWVRQARIAA